jgi:hypothetical protein
MWREQPGGVQGSARSSSPLSVPELRRLLWHLVLVVQYAGAHILAWSQWRRWHQAVAKYYHYKRREAWAGILIA